ncbi:MAG TPA: hypothetical protein VHI13_02655 [Candidatus Kapabacteria bacterium]|nr:hypothetical protein [Candidatus Kapabacteria bacterium]
MKAIFSGLFMAIVALIVSAPHACAQDDPPPCIIINGVKCYVQYDQCRRIIAINCPGGSRGVAQFRLLPAGDPCANADNTDLNPNAGYPLNAALQPVSVDVTVPDQNYGVIHTRLDPTRTPGNTTVVSVNPDAGVFPLQVRIRFYAQATVNSDPDRTYVSQTELVFGSDNVNSVSPFQNETFTLLNDVNYYDQADPTQTLAFTLQAGTTNLTIGDDAGGNGGLH